LLQFRIQLFPLRKTGQGVVDGGCDLRTKKIIVATGLRLTGGAQPIFFPKSTKNMNTTTFGSPTAQEICSNYSIRRWSFLFIPFEFESYQIFTKGWFF
jgi:hypothetical protein